MTRLHPKLVVLVAVLPAALATGTASARVVSSHEGLGELWTEPADLDQRNLLYGAGGAGAVRPMDWRFVNDRDN